MIRGNQVLGLALGALALSGCSTSISSNMADTAAEFASALTESVPVTRVISPVPGGSYAAPLDITFRCEDISGCAVLFLQIRDEEADMVVDERTLLYGGANQITYNLAQPVGRYQIRFFSQNNSRVREFEKSDYFILSSSSVPPGGGPPPDGPPPLPGDPECQAYYVYNAATAQCQLSNEAVYYYMNLFE